MGSNEGCSPQRICDRGIEHPARSGEQVMLPKVSCILPMGYGEEFVKVAIQCFLDQDYEGELELVVVDNNDEPIEDLLDDVENVKYFRTPKKCVGWLRNYGTEQASGDVC